MTSRRVAMRLRKVPWDSPVPADDVVTLEEVKRHCRVDTDEDDDLLEAMIEAAVGHLDGKDGILGRCLLTQRWALPLPDFETDDGKIRLRFPDVSAVVSVAYYDADGAEHVVDAATYLLMEDVVSSYLMVKSGSWPSGTATRNDAVTIIFEAGFGAREDVPRPIRQAILLMVADMYEYRESVVIGSSVSKISVPASAEALLRSFNVNVAIA